MLSPVAKVAICNQEIREEGIGKEESLFRRGRWGTELKALERSKNTQQTENPSSRAE